MPPADDRCTSFRHDEALSPTLCSTLPSRRAARGPLPWWGAGLRGTVMSLLLILCRRAGCHRRCLFVKGNRSAEHDINQIVFPFPRFTPNTGSSLEAQQFMHPLRIDPTLNVASVATVNPCTVLLRASDLNHSSVNAHASCRSGVPLYGGGCTTNGELGLPSRLCSLGW